MSSQQEVAMEKIEILKSELKDHLTLLDHFLDDVSISGNEQNDLEKLEKVVTCLKKNVQSLRDLREIIVLVWEETRAETKKT